MKKELQDKLYEKYPKTFYDYEHEKPYLVWGFECGDGWYNIIEAVATVIENTDNDHEVRAAQVKEKFGGLRFYTYGYTPEVEGIIEWAERVSYETCESCGNKGEPRKGGWIKTLCDECNKPKDEQEE